MLWIPLIAVAAFLALGFGFRLLENRLIFFPKRLGPEVFPELVAALPEGPETWEEISFSTRDGETLHGWFGRPEQPVGWVLWSHGNAGSMVHRWQDFSRLVRISNLAVLIYDYRGYGRSSGKPCEAGVYLDSRAAWDALVGLGADPERVHLLGRSLGGAVSLELAASGRGRGLILESTFTSLRDMAHTVVPFFPAHWFAKSEFPSIERIAGIEAPILMFHGTRDELVPFAQGERLAKAATRSASVQFVPVDEAGHNDVSERLGRAYFTMVRSFVEGDLA